MRRSVIRIKIYIPYGLVKFFSIVFNGWTGQTCSCTAVYKDIIIAIIIIHNNNNNDDNNDTNIFYCSNIHIYGYRIYIYIHYTRYVMTLQRLLIVVYTAATMMYIINHIVWRPLYIYIYTMVRLSEKKRRENQHVLSRNPTASLDTRYCVISV